MSYKCPECGFLHGDPLWEDDVWEGMLCMKPSHKKLEAAAREVVKTWSREVLDLAGHSAAIENLEELLK